MKQELFGLRRKSLQWQTVPLLSISEILAEKWTQPPLESGCQSTASTESLQSAFRFYAAYEFSVSWNHTSAVSLPTLTDPVLPLPSIRSDVQKSCRILDIIWKIPTLLIQSAPHTVSTSVSHLFCLGFTSLSLPLARLFSKLTSWVTTWFCLSLFINSHHFARVNYMFWEY